MGKRYVSEEIGTEYQQWKQGETIFLNFPTGYGKSSFVIGTFMPYMRSKGKKILILCNRRLLKLQYSFEFLGKFNSLNEEYEAVTADTYQNLHLKYAKQDELAAFIHGFDAVIFDEAHYFIHDSDFNGAGTFLLFQKLIKVSASKTKVFITATPELISPIIRNALCSVSKEFVKECLDVKRFEGVGLVRSYGNLKADYNHFCCIEIADMTTLLYQIASSNKKSILFTDSKDKAEAWRKKLIGEYHVPTRDIVFLNADKIDDHQAFIMHLAGTNIMDCKILLTTSVLDNGVSIHDLNVENLVIFADEPISFRQMAGRVRAEKIEKLNLLFVAKTAGEYSKLLREAEAELAEAEKYYRNHHARTMSPACVIQGVFSSDVKVAGFYRKYFLVVEDDTKIYSDKDDESIFESKRMRVKVSYGGVHVVFNSFALEKLRNRVYYLRRLYKAALVSSRKVICEKMSWLGIAPEQLVSADNSNNNSRQELLEKYLLEMVDYSLEEYQAFKESIAKKYPDLLNFDVRNGSFSNDKMQTLCAKCGYELEIKQNENRRKVYSVVQRSGGAANE